MILPQHILSPMRTVFLSQRKLLLVRKESKEKKMFLSTVEHLRLTVPTTVSTQAIQVAKLLLPEDHSTASQATMMPSIQMARLLFPAVLSLPSQRQILNVHTTVI